MKFGHDLTADEVIKAFGSANFGSLSKIKVISQGLLKCATGYHQGATSQRILKDLGLITGDYRLTERGRQNLWVLFKDQNLEF